MSSLLIIEEPPANIQIPCSCSKKTRRRLRRLQIDPVCESCGCEVNLANSCLKKVEGKADKQLLCISCSRRKVDNQGQKNRNNRFARVRRKFWERNPCCHYCGAKLEFIESTLDHVIPRSKGGTGKQSNLVLSCLPCNLAKGDSDVATFRASEVA